MSAPSGGSDKPSAESAAVDSGSPTADRRPVVLGKVLRPQGLGGEVRVFPYHAESELLGDLETVTLSLPGAATRTVAIERARRGPRGTWIVRFASVRSREAAEALRDATVAVARSALPPLPAGEWYHHDLIGLEVRSPAGRGRVHDVLPYPTVDCLLVEISGAWKEVPMADPWLEAVDVAAGWVRLGVLDDLPVVAPDAPGAGGVAP